MFASFPELIAGYHVFRRLSMPRHPPCTLSSLTTFIDHRHRPRAWPTTSRTSGLRSDHPQASAGTSVRTSTRDTPIASSRSTRPTGRHRSSSPKRCSTTRPAKTKRPSRRPRGSSSRRRNQNAWTGPRSHSSSSLDLSLSGASTAASGRLRNLLLEPRIHLSKSIEPRSQPFETASTGLSTADAVLSSE